MKTTFIKAISYRLLLAVVFVGIVLTVVTALIPTGQSYVATDFETTSITGETLVALACEGSPGALHERHGVPLDLIWYTQCEGTHILAFPLILNLLFWFAITSVVGTIYVHFSRRPKQ